MRIAAIQCEAVAADVAANITRHLEWVDRVQTHNVDLIIFPELSLSGYEPHHAEALSMSADDAQLHPLANASTQAGTSIGIGLPLNGEDKPRIGQLYFHPDGTRTTYAKQFLHADETAIFEAGAQQALMNFGDMRVSPAICYEVLKAEHAQSCASLGASIYLASVAKHGDNMQRAHTQCAETARLHGMTVVIANAVGKNDNYVSAGLSAAWGPNGKRIAMLADQTEGFLLIDTQTQDGRGFTL